MIQHAQISRADIKAAHNELPDPRTLPHIRVPPFFSSLSLSLPIETDAGTLHWTDHGAIVISPANTSTAEAHHNGLSMVLSIISPFSLSLSGQYF
jgi:hypothetical protein